MEHDEREKHTEQIRRIMAGTRRKETSGEYIVRQAKGYIEENYMRKLSLLEVAEKNYVSQWHLSKLFNKHLGMSFSELLSHVRIEAAKKLLQEPRRKVGEIAVAVGFSDSAHFCHVFKKELGISAREYRSRWLRGMYQDKV